MLFNSIDFAIFLPIVFALYWIIPARRIAVQNTLIVLASYLFYGWWDWRFLSLILFSTLVDYFAGIGLAKTNHTRKRKLLLGLSIVVNIGFLGFFKYFNFFLENFTAAFSFFGQEINTHSLNIVLPVGISFYTFQTLSYTIDVYKRKIQPTRDFIAFTAFVSFFPQLVAGPIERATNLLPQFYAPRKFEYDKAVNGLRQMLWGLFKKVVIADNCAVFADMAFDHSADYSGSTLLLGALFFAIQIYCDFSGYSDIAIGTSRLFGFNLMQNFAFPYFSRDIAEFWRRWHISLSTWFRDYLYIPLGGSRGGTLKSVRNIFVIFVVSGFWHGANWTFIAWGVLNAIYFLPLLLLKRNRHNITIVASGSYLPSAGDLLRMLFTFGLTVIAWIFFRAQNIEHAFGVLSGIASGSLLEDIQFPPEYIGTMMLTGCFILVEWFGRERKFAIEHMFAAAPRLLRWAFYAAIIFCIGMFMQTKESPFIYFQF